MNPSRKQRKTKDEIFVPFMVYMAPKELKALKAYAANAGKPATAIMREGMRIRINGDRDPYVLGYNDGVTACLSIAKRMEETKIVMPSGKSILDLLADRFDQEYMEEK